MLRPRNACSWMSTLSKLHKSRTFSSSNRTTNAKNESNSSTYDESYKQLKNLDFMTAARILFADPPKEKKFGLDFHLVQFFFACLPSFAVYLVAQYARYEIRRMEGELEQKKKKEEEEKAKEEELKSTGDKKIESEKEKEVEYVLNPELLEVKVRLEKLEEVVKEIAVGSNKRPASGISKTQQDCNEKRTFTTNKPNDTTTSKPSRSVEQDQQVKEQKSPKETPNLSPVSEASSHEDQKGKNQSAGAS